MTRPCLVGGLGPFRGLVAPLALAETLACGLVTGKLRRVARAAARNRRLV